MASQIGDHSAMRPASLRVANAALVMERLADGAAMSRAELASSTSLSSQALGSIVGDLVEAGLVVERVRETTSPGRPPTEYTINPVGSFTVTVFGRTTDYIVLIDDAEHARRANVRVRFQPPENPEALIGSIARTITQAIGDCGLEAKRLRTIEFGVVGQIAGDRRVVVQTVMWLEQNIDVATALESAIGHPVEVTVVTIQQAQAAHALTRVVGDPGELVAVLYLGIEHRIMLAKGGQFVAGSDGISGFLSHVPVAGNDRRCECGQIGCLITVAGEAALLSVYHELSGLRLSNAVDVMDRVGQSDPSASGAVERLSHWLTVGLAPILQVIMPDRIILVGGTVGGGESPGARRLVQSLREQLASRHVHRPIHVVGSAILEEVAHR